MTIRDCLQKRILILDGAMGTLIQTAGLPADTFHRGRFTNWPVSLTGNNDVLCLTAPDVISDIHRRYIAAGADIITTDTFSANRISQHEYGCEEMAREMAFEGARIARQAADSCKERKIWVAGSMGPTPKSLSLAADMNQPALRTITFDEMAAAYREQAEALLEGGADVLLIETCFDALNTKAALYAIQQINEQTGKTADVMVSATINDRSGRTLTGQTLEAFYVSISHYPLLSFGLNCSFGVTDLRPFVERLAQHVPTYLSLHPNAGLPNEMGEYEELPDFTASHLRSMAEAGLLNIAGGCCGTDDRHIHAISEALKGITPRRPAENRQQLWTSGLDPLLIDRQTTTSEETDGQGGLFINVGERTNVAGSRKFARLIAAKQYDEAMTVARHQIEGGALVIDINMDDAMLDSRQEMQTFCRYISNDPAVGRSVLMIDSSDWLTVLAGLKNALGKCIVNSISLKNGADDFLSKARELRRLGAAVVVMAFDEEGQATTYDRKIAIAQRAYDLLTGIGFPPQDIIFDVNILSVATGISEHQNYGIDFIRAVAWIKQHLPYAKTSGGVSNLSFAFRGNNKVREAMHSVFLYHAIHAGLDMAIVNPAMLQVYDEIEPSLLKAVEDVILNSDDDATNRLVALSAEMLTQDPKDGNSNVRTPLSLREAGGRPSTVEERLANALRTGNSEYLSEDIPEALQKYGRPIDVIEQPLMQAMEHIGQLFGEGKMFLPQVVKSAKVMKEAVSLLQSLPQAAPEGESQPLTAPEGNEVLPTVVMATANGDVHDIGKNIVSIVLSCNGFNVIDLGVMVPCDAILQEALKRKPCLVGISGLITPSLKEMEQLCRLFQQHQLQIPIVVGGATTSAVHTAVKLAPLYDGCVVYGGDASQTSVLAKRLQMNPEETIRNIKAEQALVREAYNEHHAELVSYEEANRRAPVIKNGGVDGANGFNGADGADGSNGLSERSVLYSLPVSELLPLIDWRMFLLFWGFKGETLQQLLVNPEAEKTLKEGQQYLQNAIANNLLDIKAVQRIEQATRRGNDIVLADGTVLPMLRSQNAAGHYLCMADYFDEQHPSPLGLFTIVARPVQEPADEAEKLMSHALCARLAEAGACSMQNAQCTMHNAQCTMHNGQRSMVNGQCSPLRVAFGYASSPDHSLKRIVFDRLDAERQLGITLTDRYSIQPSTSICGMFIFHREARYFPVGRIDRAQLTDYCRRRGITVEEGERLLSKYITSS